uniref:Uncharacterized protein n=1 Tax=Arundo donax TaxID=35708 RepID=A0A0A8ZWB5_ARUDO
MPILYVFKKLKSQLCPVAVICRFLAQIMISMRCCRLMAPVVESL